MDKKALGIFTMKNLLSLSMNIEQVENMDGIQTASEMFIDDFVKTVDKSTDEYEESFQTYVKVYFQA